jgi:3-dehydroquinate synthase
MQVLSLPQYDIHIGAVCQPFADWLEAQPYRQLAVLTDDHTLRYCWPLLQPLLGPRDIRLIVIPAGEEHKQLDTCQYIWNQLFDGAFTRADCLINLGGGVIGDMGGFAAATYKRGIDFIQLPTTLLAQVDASVGGKLGIDYRDIKNSIGLFQAPKGVWIDPVFLRTLPFRQLRSGFAEVIKHVLIADATRWSSIRQLGRLEEVDWQPWIAHSVGIKQAVVMADFQEQGIRKALNFGHTIGHAVESYLLPTEAPLLHGEAIALGMVAEAWLSYRCCGLPYDSLLQIVDLINAHFEPCPLPPAADSDLLARMRQDKKNKDHRINFSLLTAIGEAVVDQSVEESRILESIHFYREYARR